MSEQDRVPRLPIGRWAGFAFIVFFGPISLLGLIGDPNDWPSTTSARALILSILAIVYAGVMHMGVTLLTSALAVHKARRDGLSKPVVQPKLRGWLLAYAAVCFPLIPLYTLVTKQRSGAATIIGWLVLALFFVAAWVGMPGAFAVVKAKAGKLTLGQQGSAGDFGYFDKPPIKLTKDEKTLYTGLMTAFWSDSNFTPDFPRTGEIMRAMYKQKFGAEVDGVISIDPIALSYILKGTGPVKTTAGKTITSENAVDQLLNRVYLDYPNDNAAQDAFFADTAKQVFDAVAAGKGNPRDVLAGMAKAVGENRILIWSADKAEQETLSDTPVAGSLPGDSGSTPHVGVYINDATATKLEYYLDAQTGMHTNSCTKDGI